MDSKDVIEEFKLFEEEHGEDAFLRLDEFISSFKEEYLDIKTKELLDKKDLSKNEAHNKARQSWRPFVGDLLEQLLDYAIKDFIKEEGYENIFVTNDREIKGSGLSKEKDLVRRMVQIHYDEHSLLPDADLIVYSKQGPEQIEIISIISLKNSFRERYTETPYWKLKLEESDITKEVNVFMVTPDKDDEISHLNRNTGEPKKARIVLSYDLDGVYLAREDFVESENVQELGELFVDLKQIIENKNGSN